MEFNTQLNIAIEALNNQKAVEKAKEGDVLAVKDGKVNTIPLQDLELNGATVAEWMQVMETRVAAIEASIKAMAETNDANTTQIVEAIQAIAQEINNDKLILK